MNWSIVISISSIVSVFITVCIAVWKLSAWKHTWEHKLDDLEPVRQNVNVIVDALRKIDQIYDLLLTLHGQGIFKKSSPVSLTEQGKTLSQKINAPSLVQRYENQIKEKVVNMNAYEIQQ